MAYSFGFQNQRLLYQWSSISDLPGLPNTSLKKNIAPFEDVRADAPGLLMTLSLCHYYIKASPSILGYKIARKFKLMSKFVI